MCRKQYRTKGGRHQKIAALLRGHPYLTAMSAHALGLFDGKTKSLEGTVVSAHRHTNIWRRSTGMSTNRATLSPQRVRY
jgi:hypothetical protein